MEDQNKSAFSDTFFTLQWWKATMGKIWRVPTKSGSPKRKRRPKRDEGIDEPIFVSYSFDSGKKRQQIGGVSKYNERAFTINYNKCSLAKIALPKGMVKKSLLKYTWHTQTLSSMYVTHSFNVSAVWVPNGFQKQQKRLSVYIPHDRQTSEKNRIFNNVKQIAHATKSVVDGLGSFMVQSP